ncbi:O-methyltransferase [Rubrobacter calidifluminis]|uniref:O-methyltransferase n=1 Tax=Rubrobacter calidifluminis TaxID=1392640 RepID=UPI002362C8BC|nr:O-methyltransferase [Rubrobacter calidifluminis]
MMDEAVLEALDAYVECLFAPQDEALEFTLSASRRAGLPDIQVSPAEGRLLQLLALMVGAGRILEIGTLGGYSAIHLARALPDVGTMVSLEASAHHAEVARANIEHAGLSEKVEVRTGDARKLLARMIQDGEEPFDVVFIDADKRGYPEYLELSLTLSHPGTLILADNTFRGGAVVQPADETSRVLHEFNLSLARDPRLDSILIPVVRERVDGLSIARVKNI